MAQIPGIYVEIKGDSSQLAKDMRQAKQLVSESAKGMSNALNNALSGPQISKGTNQLINSLGTLDRASKVSAQTFKQIGVDLGSLQRVTGVTGAQFQQLQSKMLQTAGAKAQEKALRDIARAADLTEKEIKQLGQQFGLSKTQIAGVIGSTSKATGAFGALGTAIKTSLAFLSVGVLASWGAGIVRVADQYTLLESRLRLVTNGAENLAQIEEQLYQISLRTHQSQTDTVDLYTRMARATEQLGTSQSDLLTITESINQALIVSGASATESSAALIQLSQGLASGVLRGEEFNSVMEQTPRLAQALADGIGVTIGELRKMAGEGKLTSEVITKALLSQKDVIAREYGQMTTTISQAFTDLRTVIAGIIDDTNDASGATSGVVTAVEDLAKTIDANKEAITNIFAGLIQGAGFAVTAIGNVYRSIEALGVVAASRDKSLWDWITADDEDIKGWFKDIGDGTAFLADKLSELKDKRQELAESWTFTSEARKQKQESLAAIDEEIAGIKKQIETRKTATTEQVRSQKTVTESVKATSKVVVESAEKEIKANKEKFNEQKRLAAEMTDMIKTSAMTQTEVELHELEKRKAAHMEIAEGNIALQQKVTEAYAQEQNRLTMLIEAGIDKRTAAEREALDDMKDGWIDFNEGKAAAADRAGKEIQESEKETTNVIIDEWSNAFESIQSALADMIYDFDFSMDSILDIFKRMLAEMLAAIVMSGIKDAFSGLFGDGAGGTTGGIISGIKELFSGFGGDGKDAAGGGIGWGTLGGGLALAGGAYGLFAGGKSLQGGNAGTGALQMGLGAVSAYKGAVALGLLEEGTATALGKSIASSAGFQSAIANGVSSGYTAGAGATSYSTFQSAASGSSAAGGFGISGAASAATYATVAAAAVMAVKGIYDKSQRPNAANEIDYAGVTSKNLEAIYNQWKAIDQTVLASIPGFERYTQALYSTSSSMLVATGTAGTIALKFNEASAAGHQWTSVLTTMPPALMDAMEKSDAYTAALGDTSEGLGETSQLADASRQALDGLNTMLTGSAAETALYESSLDSLTGSMSDSTEAADSAKSSLSGLNGVLPETNNKIFSLSDTVGQLGDASSGAASTIGMSVREIWKYANSASSMVDSLISSGRETSYHAEGGMFLGRTRIGSHVFGESGPEAIVPLPYGPDSFEKLFRKIDQISTGQTSKAMAIHNHFYVDGREVATQVKKITTDQSSRGFARLSA